MYPPPPEATHSAPPLVQISRVKLQQRRLPSVKHTMQATPDDVLSALELHLKPLLATQLPSALRLFGHLTFLRDTVNEQASAALAVHAASRARGGLTDEEVEVIRGCIKPRGGEDMRRLSLEMRQAVSHSSICGQWTDENKHMHLVLSNPKSDVDRLALMLDTYFPSLPEDEEERAEAQAAHKMPFIRHISAEEADGLEAYRAPFQWFLDDARASVLFVIRAC